MPQPIFISDDIKVYAGHNQFCLEDNRRNENASKIDFAEWESAWTSEASERHLAQIDGQILIGTADYSETTAVVEIHEAEPQTDFASFDHVAEASLQIRSGTLQVVDCPSGNTAASFPISIGSYRVRVLSEGLARAENTEPFNLYTLQLWPAPMLDEPRVLKWYPNWKHKDWVPSNLSGMRVIVGHDASHKRRAMKCIGIRKAAERRFAVSDLYFDESDDSYWVWSTIREAPTRELLLEIPVKEVAKDFFISSDWKAIMAETMRQHMSYVKNHGEDWKV